MYNSHNSRISSLTGLEHYDFFPGKIKKGNAKKKIIKMKKRYNINIKDKEKKDS